MDNFVEFVSMDCENVKKNQYMKMFISLQSCELYLQRLKIDKNLMKL